MSKEIKTGGPAFPFAYEDEVTRYVSHGISLRDYFAAKAMQGFCAANDYVDMDYLAKFAYITADAMLKARGSNE